MGSGYLGKGVFVNQWALAARIFPRGGALLIAACWLQCDLVALSGADGGDL